MPMTLPTRSHRGYALRASGRRATSGRVPLLLACLLCAAVAACDSPTTPKAKLDLVARPDPLRGAYGLPTPVTMPDGRRLYWAQLSFWGKNTRSEGEDTWTGTYSVKDGPDCLAGLARGTFTLSASSIATGSPSFKEAQLTSDRQALDVTIDADGTSVRAHLVLGAQSPL